MGLTETKFAKLKVMEIKRTRVDSFDELSMKSSFMNTDIFYFLVKYGHKLYKG